MNMFEEFKRLEDKLTGNIKLPEIGVVTVELDLEDHSAPEDLTKLMAEAETWLSGFDMQILEGLKTAIAAELTDAAYAGSDYQPVNSDYVGLEHSLQLKTICFYIDAETSLTFLSETEYPDMYIYCLLDESYSISDLFVEGK